MTQTESSPDQAYFDRNLVVQLAAKLAIQCGLKAGIRERHGQWPILYIDLPTGQVSWHIPADELIPGLPDFPDTWDGHDLKTKRNRLIDFVESM
jgi:phosphodiesterase/alkaline phosphatase D-like protein